MHAMCLDEKGEADTHGRSSRRKKQAALEESFRQKCSEYAIQFSLTLCVCMYYNITLQTKIYNLAHILFYQLLFPKANN